MGFELEDVLVLVEKFAKMANIAVPAIRKIISIWEGKL